MTWKTEVYLERRWMYRNTATKAQSGWRCTTQHDDNNDDH